MFLVDKINVRSCVSPPATTRQTPVGGTKNTEQNKTKNRKPKQESIYYKRSGGIHCEEYMLCDTASNNILENANREEDMLCVTTAEIHKELQDEDMLCFTASLIVKKI